MRVIPEAQGANQRYNRGGMHKPRIEEEKTMSIRFEIPPDIEQGL